MNHAYLSKNDIEHIAKRVSKKYKSVAVPQKHLCYSVDPVKLAEILGFHVDFQRLTRDGSILGLTAPDEALIPVLDTDNNPFLYLLDGKTVLVEERLNRLQQFQGRRNFTIAHEIAHQLLYRLFPDTYGIQRRTLCDYRRSHGPKKPISDWTEWQADALGAAILLPEDAVLEGMFFFGLGEHMKVLSRKYSPNNYESFCRMVDFLGVSQTALSYRMEQLGLLERNLLCKEWKRRA